MVANTICKVKRMENGLIWLMGFRIIHKSFTLVNIKMVKKLDFGKSIIKIVSNSKENRCKIHDINIFF